MQALSVIYQVNVAVEFPIFVQLARLIIDKPQI